MRHTADLVAVEQSLGIYVERGVQDAVRGDPDGAGPFSGWPTSCSTSSARRRCSSGCTAVTRTGSRSSARRSSSRRPGARRLRPLPGSPPRLADLGFSDTVSRAGPGIDLSSDLLGGALQPVRRRPEPPFRIRPDRRRRPCDRGVTPTRARAGWRCTRPAMLLIIVGTGNHFIVDAVLGGLVVAAGWLAARAIVTSPEPRPQLLALANCPHA